MEAQLAQKLVLGLKQAGIDLVTYLPETRLSQILPLLRDDPVFTLVPVASESEAVTIGAGGIEKIHQIELTADEKAMFQKSFASVKKTVDEIKL